MISKRSAGFTLLELMTAVGISAILLAIAVPAFRNITVNSQLTAQVNDLVSALNVARSEAIKRNGTITFCRAPLATSTACATSAGDWANWIVRTSGGTVLRRGTVATDSAIAVVSDLDTDTMTFSSDGLARTGGALVTLKTIRVSTTKLSRDNLRCITVGGGSRISTKPQTGPTCT